MPSRRRLHRPQIRILAGTEFGPRQLDHRRENVGFGVGIHAGPWRLAAQVRRGEVSAAAGVEQILDAVKIEEERIAAAAGEERNIAGLDDVGLGPEGHLGIADNLRPDSFGGAGFRAFCHEDADSLLAVLRLREHVAERDVGQAVAVVVDVEAVDGVGMKRVGLGIGIEDDHGPRGIRGRLERVEVAEVESLVAERRSETESGEMVRHSLLPFGIESGGCRG